MTLVGTERGSRVCMARSLPRVMGFRLNLSRNLPWPAAARGSRAFVKALEDEPQRPDVEKVAGGLGDSQHANEPFTVGGAVVDNGGRVTHRGALRSCEPASRRRAPARSGRPTTRADKWRAHPLRCRHARRVRY